MEVKYWTTLSDFARDSDLSDAEHVIRLPGGGNLCFMLSGFNSKVSGTKFLTFFSGALIQREGTSPPYYSGKRIANDLSLPMLSFSDPIYECDDHIALGWFAGAPSQELQRFIAAIVDQVAAKYEAPPLLIGGSGGGFAATVTLAHLEVEHAMAFVWNAQTDIRRYVPTSVAAYFDAIEVPYSIEEIESTAVPAGIDWTLPVIHGAKYLVFLQNESDWHTQAHALPYARQYDDLSFYDGVLCSDSFTLAISNYGAGHAVPPRNMLANVIGGLSSVGIESDAIRNVLYSAGVFDTWDTRRNLLAEKTKTAESHVEMKLAAALHHDENGSIIETLVTGESGSKTEPPAGVYITASYRSVDGTRGATGKFNPGSLRIPGIEVAMAYVVLRQADGTVLSDISLRPEPRPADGAHVGTQTERTASEFFILGSCVSRDAFSLPGAPKISTYVARTSLADAFLSQPKGTLPEYAKNPSAFQQRMVQIDWEKRLRGMLMEQAGSSLVLVDCIDERFDIIQVNGTWVTYSPELQACGFDASNYEKMSFNHPSRERMIMEGWSELRRLVPAGRLCVSKVFWAERSENGEPLGDPEAIRASNASLRQLYRAIDKHVDHWVTYGPEDLIGADVHKWGRSPFHFVDSFYKSTLRQLEAIEESIR